MAASHTFPFPVCLGSRLRAGPFLSLFPGNLLYKDWGRLEECLFHACLCRACIPSMGPGPSPPRWVSLRDTGPRRERLGRPSSVHVSGERFHLPNPSPTICPQRGTKGLLTAQISPSSYTAPGRGASGLTGTVKTPSKGAGMCMRMLEDWKVDVRLQVPKRAGRPGMGVVPDSKGQIRLLCPHALLLSAERDAEHLYPFCCQIEKGQGLEEDNPDPKPVLPGLWHWGGPVCLC